MAKVEVVGRSREKVEEIFREAVTQVRADLAGIRGINFRDFVRQMDINGNSESTLPLLSVMMTAWTDAPWNGSATTS